MNDYHPINCEFHDVLESLATRKRRCVVTYRSSDGSTRFVEAVIADVFAREGAEFLLLDSGDVIRLDALASVDGIKPDAFGP
ncbi:MAG: hypothetical protein V4569_07765 [Pseudomonadota bacterium]